MEGRSTTHRQSLKNYFENPCLLLGLRVVVGVTLVAASIDKIAEPAAFALSIANYRVLPDSLTLYPATFLPWMELLCGLSLLFGLMVRGSALLTSFMLILFTAAVLSALLRGLDIACGCFTQGQGAEVIGWWKIAENTGLICATLVLLWGGEGVLSLEGYLRRQESHRFRDTSDL